MDQLKPYVLVYLNDGIKSVLQQPLAHTQRIKYTCYDVSQNFIIMGASSGGLYVFRREPCSFIQIIPNQEGSVAFISISPNEKYVGFTTTKKVFCVLQFNDANKLNSKVIYRERFDELIACSKWNIYSTEIFLGDRDGQIFVVVIGDFLTKTMFQSCCYPLMKLDSQIVQFDWNTSLLLVSTQTRCFICDTEREEYRQIGQKLRDGEYGACFLNRNESDTSLVLNSTEAKRKNWFTSKPSSAPISGVAEQISITDNTNIYSQQLKIYCSRPGARLWEVVINGTVAKTLQFKDIWQQTPHSDIIIHNNNDSSLRLEVLEQKPPPEVQANFTYLYVIKKQFLVTFKKDCIFILEPETMSVTCWCYSPCEIVDIRIIGSSIYIWHSESTITLMNFIEIEKLLMRSFFNKQYLFCADLCARYLQLLIHLVPTSKKLYLLNMLKDKLDPNSGILKQIEPLMQKIKDETVNRQNVQPLASQTSGGVFIVDNAFYNVHKADEDIVFTPAKSDPLIVERKRKIVEKPQRELTKNNTDPLIYSKIECVEMPLKVTAVNSRIDILYQYFKLSKMSKMLNCDAIDDILSTYTHISHIHALVNDLFNYMVSVENDTECSQCKLWCFNIFLRFIELSECKSHAIFDELLDSADLINYFFEAFTELNSSNELGCKHCGFPLPSATLFNTIRYYQICHLILEILWLKDNNLVLKCCQLVPYLWRIILPHYYKSDTDIDKFLSLLVQYNNVILLEHYLYKLDELNVRQLIEMYIKLKETSECLRCGKTICIGKLIDWNEFSLVILKVFGGEKTLQLLMDYGHSIPNGTLQPKFYQMCLLSHNCEDFHHFNLLAENNPQKFIQDVENMIIDKCNEFEFQVIQPTDKMTKQNQPCL